MEGSMENGNPPKKKSKRKKIRSNSPQVSNGSDKQNFYCGFSSRTVRNICEQVDNTEIQPEVYSRLAEDATYKLMEVVTNIKNYGKHSGGRVTFDITNEVFKDSNCAPVIGSDNKPKWDSVEDDHRQSIFFNQDDINSFDVIEEFNRHITEENVNGPVFLTTSFLLDEKTDKHYIDFYNNICEAIFTGDEHCEVLALNSLCTSPHIAGLVKHFLIKWIDMIAVNYSNNILDRSIKYLLAVVRNPYACNSDMNIELKHVCQLLVNLLVGSINDEIRENGNDNEIEPEASDSVYSTYDSNIVSYDGNNGIIDNNNRMNIDEMSSDSNMKAFDERSGILVENFSIESEKMRTLKDELTEGFEIQSASSSKLMVEHLEDGSKDSASSRSLTRRNDIEDEFNALLSTNCASTMKCDDKYLDEICQIIGMCSAKWSGVENYLSMLIISEVENFFKANKRLKMDGDLEWLGRIVKGLWSLGEFAFRELLIFFEKIDTRNLKETLNFANSLNIAAIYVRGKQDIFFYEFLSEVCGDKLIPFLLYYTNFILRLNRKKLINNEIERADQTRFKIVGRTLLIGYRIQRLQQSIEQKPLRIMNSPPRSIIIQYGHPISTKKLRKYHTKAEERKEILQNSQKLRSFNQRIVVLKGRLNKPISNMRMREFHPNFNSITL